MYIKKIFSGGVDWHDAYTSVQQLMENGKYEIENAVDVIITDILTEFPYLRKEDLLHTIQNETIFKFPIKNAEKVNDEYVYYDCDMHPLPTGNSYQNEGIFDGKKLIIDSSYGWGMSNYETHYVVDEASREDIKYLVEEQFYCPAKGIELVERFYEEPFENLEDAQKYFDELELHDNMDCGKELLIFSTKIQPDDQWYNNNMKALKLMKEKKQNHLDKSFHIYAQHHIKELEKL